MPRKAKARMLWGNISTSERVNQLSLKAALLFTWMIAHADDQGRMSGNPATVKGIVCPMRDDITKADIVDLLREIEDKELILIYPAYEQYLNWPIEDAIIQIIDWWDYQALREPQASKYAAHECWQDRIGRQARDKTRTL